MQVVLVVFTVFLHIRCCVVVPSTTAILNVVQGVEGVIRSDFTFGVCTVYTFLNDGARTIDDV